MATTGRATLDPSTFGLERVNRFLLRKQHLAPRASGDDIITIVEDICALHSTVAFSPYLRDAPHFLGRFTRSEL